MAHLKKIQPTLLLFALLFFNSFNSAADVDDYFEELLTEIHFDAESLKKMGYLSAHGYVDEIQNKKSYNPSDEPTLKTYKLFEIAFTPKGKIAFSRKCKLSNLGQHFGTTYLMYEKFNYDNWDRVIHSANKSKNVNYNYDYTYDHNGNLLTTKSTFDGEPRDSFSFTWSDNKMIAHSYTRFYDDSGELPHFEFNAKGEMVKAQYDHEYRLERFYTKTDSTETVRTLIYQNDTLSRETIISYNNADQITYYFVRDDVDTLHQLKMKYDTHMNMTSLIYDIYPDEYERTHSKENVNQISPYKRTITVLFENKYQHGLIYSRLIKTKGYDSFSDFERTYLLRIHYEVDTLAYQSWYVEPKYKYNPNDTVADMELIIEPEDVEIEEIPPVQEEKKEKKK